MTTEVTTHKAELDLGPAVIDGRLIWSSASKITVADPNSSGGCLRKWHYENVGGRRQPSTPAQERGTKLHAEIEGHLIHGNPLLTQLAIAGRQYIDAPGPGIMIEAPLARRVGDNIETWLTGNGIPIGGHVDLWNHRGSHLDREGDLRADPPRTLETKDWKTTSDFKWAKSPAELAENIQLITYAEAGFRMWPNYDFSRLTHVAFRTKGRPEAQLNTVIVDRDHVARRWEYAEAIMRTIADAARETNVDLVDANKKSCSAFRGCPHRAICTAAIPSDYDSLEDILGPRGAAGALARLGGSEPTLDLEPGDLPAMSLINKLDPAVVAAGVASQPAPTQPSLAPAMPTAAGVGVELRVDAEVARLEAEERARRAAQVVAPPQPPAGFIEAYNAIAQSGRGMPSFAGSAAVLVGSLTKVAPLEYNGKPWISGTGWLATAVKQPVEDPTHLIPLSREVGSLPPMQAAPIAPPPAPPPPPPPAPPVQAPAIAVLPPDAPPSNPALAANPVEGLDNAKTRELAMLTSPVIPGLAESIAAPIGTPPPMNQAIPAMAMPSLIGAPPAPSEPPPQISTATVSTPVTEITIPVEGAKKGPGRPRGSSRKKTTTVTEKVGEVERTVTNAVDNDSTIDLFVDCMPAGDFDRLEPYIDQVNTTLSKEYGAADVRCPPKDGPLGYGGAEGAVTALVRRSPPPPGRYVVSTRGNRLASWVVNALRAKVDELGGEFVEGWPAS